MSKKLKFSLAVVGLLVVLVTVVAISFTNIHRHVLTFDGPSMEPTIKNGQSIVWKQYPKGKLPVANDVVLFMLSGLNRYNQTDTKLLVKRVIGVPGDHVVVANNTIVVTNTLHLAGYNPDRAIPAGAAVAGSIDIILTSDQYFVIGDNPSNSLDSRAFGPIRLTSIKGSIDLMSQLGQDLNNTK